MKKTEYLSKDKRFQFGTNWQDFLHTLNNERISEAERSLKEMLGVQKLTGKRFLDIGSGSGLFSLAAKRLGAKVYSFDYDKKSVDCTKELKRRFYENDNDWIIDNGSILDDDYMNTLGKFDIVYSWGVLHHTGNIEKALKNAASAVDNYGVLFISIYNDQGAVSTFWLINKKIYCHSIIGRFIVCSIYIPLFFLMSVAVGIAKHRNPAWHFINYKKKRGMSIWHDWIDWIGGYPFEVAKPEYIFIFFKKIGFILDNITTTNGMGCNQFVFRKNTDYHLE